MGLGKFNVNTKSIGSIDYRFGDGEIGASNQNSTNGVGFKETFSTDTTKNNDNLNPSTQSIQNNIPSQTENSSNLSNSQSGALPNSDVNNESEMGATAKVNTNTDNSTRQDDEQSELNQQMGGSASNFSHSGTSSGDGSPTGQPKGNNSSNLNHDSSASSNQNSGETSSGFGSNNASSLFSTSTSGTDFLSNTGAGAFTTQFGSDSQFGMQNTGAMGNSMGASGFSTASLLDNTNASNLSIVVDTGATTTSGSKSIWASIGDFFVGIWEDVKDLGATIANGIVCSLASLANLLISITKGLAQFVEALLDVVVLVGTLAGSIVTLITDYLLIGCFNLIFNGGYKAGDLTSSMWKGVMSFVATDYVGNAVASWYQEGNWLHGLDEKAYAPFKSDGLGCQIGAGIGYVGGIVLLTIATLGIGTAVSAGASAASAGASAVGVGTTAFTTTSAIIAGIAGVGKGTAEAWAYLRDKEITWVEIENMVQNGDIDQETYNLFISIRNLSDDEFKELESQVTPEDYEMLVGIRNIKEDWRTLENGIKGGTYGIATGVLDGVQWYVGGKINSALFTKGGLSILPHIENAAIKVGLHTAQGAVNAPLRAVTSMIYNDKNLSESWEAIGGIKGVATNALIAGILSTSFEAIKLVKLNNAINTLGKVSYDVNVDVDQALKTYLINQHARGALNINKLARTNSFTGKTFDSGLANINENIGSKLDETILKMKITLAGEMYMKLADPNFEAVFMKELGLDSLFEEALKRQSAQNVTALALTNSGTITSNVASALNSISNSYLATNALYNANTVISTNVALLLSDRSATLLSSIAPLSNGYSANSVAPYLADGSEAAFFNFGKSNKSVNINQVISSDLTKSQIDLINNINAQISRGQMVSLNYKNTTEISSTMLSKISDLSKVKFVITGGLGDANGILKTKYNTQKYYDRITYTGHELSPIIAKIENIQTRIDVNLPVIERARQIYNILASEIPVMRDYQSSEVATRVSQSLRGITEANIVGKQGLICAGYASVFKELCDRLGIQADYIRGDAIIDPLTGQGGKHAWNVVITNEGIVPVDVTWKASGADEWFGPSDRFAQTHIADSFEEYYHVFNEPLKINVQPVRIQGNTPMEDIKTVITIHEQKYPGQGIDALKAVINNPKNLDNTFGYITSSGNARTMLQNIPLSDIRKYINLYDSVVFALGNHDAKYGFGTGLQALQVLVAENGNFMRITGANGARSILQQFPVADIKQFLDAEFSNKTQYVINSSYQADGSEAALFGPKVKITNPNVPKSNIDFNKIKFPDNMHSDVRKLVLHKLKEVQASGELDFTNFSDNAIINSGIYHYVLDTLQIAGFSKNDALILYGAILNRLSFISSISPDILSKTVVDFWIDNSINNNILFTVPNVEFYYLTELKKLLVDGFEKGQITFEQLKDDSLYVKMYNDVVNQETAKFNLLNSRIEKLLSNEYVGIVDKIKTSLINDIMNGSIKPFELEGTGLYRKIAIKYEEYILLDIVSVNNGLFPGRTINLNLVVFDLKKYNIDFDITFKSQAIDVALIQSIDKYYDWDLLVTNFGKDLTYRIQSDVYMLFQQNNIDLNAIPETDAQYLIHIAVTKKIVEMNPFAGIVDRNYNSDRINHQFLINQANKLANANRLTSAAECLDDRSFAYFAEKIDVPQEEFAKQLDDYIRSYVRHSYSNYQKLITVNNFARVDMFGKLKKFVAGLVSDVVIDIGALRNEFMSEESFRKIAAPRAMAHNTAVISQYSIKWREIQLFANIIHENLHLISRDVRNAMICGIISGSRYVGLNEAITEYFTKLIIPQSASGYDKIVESLNLLIQKNVITLGELKINYFVNHTIDPTLDRIFGGNQDDINKFALAFDEAISDDMTTSRLGLKTLNQMIHEILERHEGSLNITN